MEWLVLPHLRQLGEAQAILNAHILYIERIFAVEVLFATASAHTGAA